MKIAAVLLLVLGILSTSMLAVAEGPIPFSALAKSAGVQPSIPPMPDAQSSSTATAVLPPQSRPMTHSGKVLVGVGIGVVAVGAALIGIGASTKSSVIAGSQIRAVGFGAGAGFAGIGLTLIVIGTNKRVKK
jgi:hypothetical protein